MNPLDRLSWSALKLLIRAQSPQVHHLSTDALAEWLSQADRENPILLDARTEQEFAVSHLPNAQRIEPDTKDFSCLSELPLDTPIVVYCSVGYRSSKLANHLQQSGFTNVMNLEGSIFQWANEGRPIYREHQSVQQVHSYSPAWAYLLKQQYRQDGSE